MSDEPKTVAVDAYIDVDKEGFQKYIQGYIAGLEDSGIDNKTVTIDKQWMDDHVMQFVNVETRTDRLQYE